MKYMYYLVCLVLLLYAGQTHAQQNGGRLSGSLETNANFFIRDSLIGAANTPQYDRQKYGGEGWLSLNYNNWGFDFGLRFDFFNNSNLLNQPDRSQGKGSVSGMLKRRSINWVFMLATSMIRSEVVSSFAPMNNDLY